MGRPSWLRGVVAAGLAVVLLCPSAPASAAQTASLEVIGHHSLESRGLNAGLALAGRCAFVGSRGQGPVAIVDVTDPSRPAPAGSIPVRQGSTARELRAIEDRHLLVVMSFALGRGGANRFDLYHWDSDCTRPAMTGSYDFGTGSPHEFYLWREGDRILLFTTMFGSASPQLQVVDASDPAHPVLAGGWQPPVGPLHSISIDSSGRRAYLSLWTAGLAVADVSDFTSGRAGPELRLLTPVASILPPPPAGNVHSAVPTENGDRVLVTDERYPPVCPGGPARLVDVADPARPRLISVLAVAESDPASCRAAAAGTYTSHNATLTRSLALVSWYSSGLQIFDLTDPSHPAALAESRPEFGLPSAIDRQLGGGSTMSWSYPILRDGLIFLADINQGLVILRYHGPHEEEIAGAGFAEGNSNLGRLSPAPSPTPSPAPSADRPPSPTPGSDAATSKPLPAPAPPDRKPLLAGLLLALALVILWRVIRRRSGS